MHRASGRTGAFVAINCAAVVESLTESELFGLEIGNASHSFQAKLLRVLDRGGFIRVGGQQVICPDVRLVAAINANLEDLVSEGRFRPDLYYRINEVTMNLPALRQWWEDIPLLANGLLVAVNRKNNRNILELSNDAMELLVSYHWPGNLRELQNVLTRAAFRLLGITRPTLRRKMRVFNMDRVNLDVDLDEDSEGRDPSYARVAQLQ